MLQCVLADALYLEAFGKICLTASWFCGHCRLPLLSRFGGLRFYDQLEEFLLLTSAFRSSLWLDCGVKFGTRRKHVTRYQ